MKPFFSVVIPLYNKEKHIKNTLEGVLNQTFQDFEVIVINDGSTDGSLAEASDLNDERIKVYTTKNQGVSHARNYGIEKSSSDFIAFLDADDYWYPNHLEDLKKLIEIYPYCGLYAKGYESVYDERTIVKAKFLGLQQNFSGIVDDFFYHSLANQIAWTSAVSIPKTIFDTHGNFDTALRTGEDTDLWTRIALKERIAFDSSISSQKKLTSSSYHLSQSNHTSDKLKLFNKFIKEEKSNPSFKRYMDNNRFAVAIERKIAEDISNYRKIYEEISPCNISKKQRLLLTMPGWLLKFLKKFQNKLIKFNLYLSPFR